MTPREAAEESLTVKAIVIGHGIAMWGVLFLSSFLATYATNKALVHLCIFVTALVLHRGFMRAWDMAVTYTQWLDYIAHGSEP